MPSALTENFHGAPKWVWLGGAGVLAGVGWYIYKTHQAKSTNASATAPAPTTDNATYPPFGGGGSGSDQGIVTSLGDLIKELTPSTGGTDTSSTIASLTGQVADLTSQVGTLTTAPPKADQVTPPAPPPAPAGNLANTLPDNWQQIASLPPAPLGTTAVPILQGGSVIGENLVGTPAPSPDPNQQYFLNIPGYGPAQVTYAQWQLQPQNQEPIGFRP